DLPLGAQQHRRADPLIRQLLCGPQDPGQGAIGEDDPLLVQRLERLIERSKEVIRPLMNRARLNQKRIIFPDGTLPRILRAAQQLADEGICTPVLLGTEWKIRQRAHMHNIVLNGVEIVEVQDGERFDEMANELWTLRQRRGLSKQAARHMLRGHTTYGCMMLRRGEADALVGGIATPYADTIRPALQVVGLAPDARVISGAYVMLFEGRRLFFGDCTVNIRPDAETLAQIAINTARLAGTFGEVPRVAMLSYSDFGEQRDTPQVKIIREAIQIVRRLDPELQIDGEMQADTAVDPDKANNDFPFSSIGGNANVLIFPNLSSANIAYKLLRELGGATAVGPIIIGLDRIVNAIAVGSTVADIVNMTAITVNQVLEREP
ncbi:MAG: phosphate acyltransferase, partial [Myxococcota bacterium]